MFSKLFVAASLAILAVATPAPWGSPGSTTANACCTSTTTAGNSAFAGLFESLGIDVSDVNVPIGLGCSPITVCFGLIFMCVLSFDKKNIQVVGVSGTSCTNDPVSCDQIFSKLLLFPLEVFFLILPIFQLPPSWASTAFPLMSLPKMSTARPILTVLLGFKLGYKSAHSSLRV